MKLDGFTAEELRRELAKRESTVPVRNEHPDFSKLIETVNRGVAQTVNDEYQDEDFKQYVYEAAVTAIYGDSFWIWKQRMGV